MDKKIFRSGGLYDLFYKDKDYNSESNYVDKIIKESNSDSYKILELGCGTGKHATILTSKGYEIVGVDQSDSMIKNANLKKGFTCQLGDIRSFRIDNKFDAVISLFHVISYQITNKSLNRVFKTANIHLNKGGIFLFDVWYGPAVFHQKPITRIKTINVKDKNITRIAQPEFIVDSNVVKIKYSFIELNNISKEFKQYEEVHSMRYFTIPEIDYIAKVQGFEILKVEELVTCSKPSLQTWGVCFILKKNA